MLKTLAAAQFLSKLGPALQSALLVRYQKLDPLQKFLCQLAGVIVSPIF